jgi:DNA polymerase III alpha subunit (gram-positive type)
MLGRLKMSSSHSGAPELRLRDLCFIDVETTGPLFGFHEIIDLGLVRTAADGAISKVEWSCRVVPRYPERITPKAQELSGFSEDGWKGASSSNSGLWERIANMFDGCVPICHNPSFDRAFVTLAAHQAGISDLKLDYHWIGTETLAWPLYLSGQVKEFSLRGLCRHFGIPEEPLPHTAIDGARTCRMVYSCLLKLRDKTGPVP